MKQSSGFHLYLVRHGESANNALPDHQRVADPGLTQLGQKQAQHLATHYVDFGQIDHVLVSPFRRTLQTAQPLIEVRQSRASIWTDIYEVGGCFSGYELSSFSGEPGMTDVEIGREFPQFDIPDDIDENGWYKSQPIESWETAAERARLQAKKIRDSFAGNDNIVFCFIHADFKQLLVQQLAPQQKEYHIGRISNSSVTHIHFDNNVGSVVDYCNTDHLQSGEISY